MAPIKELLFDCDNTLVLSEDIAFEGCSQLVNEILEKHRISDRYTGPTLMHEFVGLGFRGQMKLLQQKYDFTMSQDEVESYAGRELETICKNLEEKCEPCEGVGDVLAQLKQDGKYGLAIVSSSAMPRVVAGIKKTGQDQYFLPNRIFSAASSLDPPSSKPDPAVYLFAAEKLGVDPKQCVAVEDSKSGATAAKNAGIPILGYVGPYLAEGGKEKQEQMAKMMKEELGAIAIMYHWSEFWDKLKEVEAAL